MDSRGQLSVEYLLLLVVIFVVFGAMITYLIGPSIDSANDISDVSASSNLVNTYANTANIIYSNGPGSKRTIKFYIPVDNTTIITSGNTVSINVRLSDNTTKVVNANTNYQIAAHSWNLSKGWHNATIYWGTSGQTWISNHVDL